MAISDLASQRLRFGEPDLSRFLVVGCAKSLTGERLNLSIGNVELRCADATIARGLRLHVCLSGALCGHIGPSDGRCRDIVRRVRDRKPLRANRLPRASGYLGNERRNEFAFPRSNRDRHRYGAGR